MTDLDDSHELDSSSEGRVSDVAERERLLAATVAHAMAQEAEYSRAPIDPRPPATWWKWLLSFVLLTTALLILAAPPRWLAPPPLPTVTGGDVELGIRAALFLQAQEIEVFRLREGRLPRSLEELDEHDPGLRYVRSDNRVYQLVARRADGSTLIWDSADPAPEGRRLARRWLDDPVRP